MSAKILLKYQAVHVLRPVLGFSMGLMVANKLQLNTDKIDAHV